MFVDSGSLLLKVRAKKKELEENLRRVEAQLLRVSAGQVAVPIVAPLPIPVAVPIPVPKTPKAVKKAGGFKEFKAYREPKIAREPREPKELREDVILLDSSESDAQAAVASISTSFCQSGWQLDPCGSDHCRCVTVAGVVDFKD